LALLHTDSLYHELDNRELIFFLQITYVVFFIYLLEFISNLVSLRKMLVLKCLILNVKICKPIWKVKRMD